MGKNAARLGARYLRPNSVAGGNAPDRSPWILARKVRRLRTFRRFALQDNAAGIHRATLAVMDGAPQRA